MTTRKEMRERRRKVRRMLKAGYDRKYIQIKLDLTDMQWYYCFPESSTIQKKKKAERRWREDHPDYLKDWEARNPGYWRTYARQRYRRLKDEREKEILEILFDIEITDEDFEEMNRIEREMEKKMEEEEMEEYLNGI